MIFRLACLFSVLPRILSPLEHVVITAGKQLELTCNVLADPPATVIWSKESLQKISRASFVNSNSTLVIRSVEISDEGKYTCLAVNRQGHTSSSATLEVKGGYEMCRNQAFCCFLLFSVVFLLLLFFCAFCAFCLTRTQINR